MSMVSTGTKAAIQRFATADARLRAALDPVVAAAIHRIGTQAQQNAHSAAIAAEEFEHPSFLSGTVGFHERGFPHAGEVRAFEGDGVAPEPFHPKVFGGPGVSDAMTDPALGPATEAEREPFRAEVAAVVREVLS